MMEIDIKINGEPIRTINCVNSGEKELRELGDLGEVEMTRYDTTFVNREDDDVHELEVWHDRDEDVMDLAATAIYTVFADVILSEEGVGA